MSRLRSLFLRNFDHRRLALCKTFCTPSDSLAKNEKTLKLSSKFALNEAWSLRFDQLSRSDLEGGYEWIAIVQKKFASAGRSSAVDVDIAVVLAEEKDQLKDLFDIIYRFRHTNLACDLLPSTEYAFSRLLLNYNDWDTFFKLLNDTINYGIFPNEHISCLAIDRLLKFENFSGAAKLATFIMQQEMFDFTILNYLSLYSLARWVELPAEKRVFDANIQPVFEEEDFNEDEIKAFKFPFLKNDYFDGHFDLAKADALVRKSLAWFTLNLPQELPETGRKELKNIVDKVLRSKEPEEISSVFDDKNALLSTLIDEVFSPVIPAAEAKLMSHQLSLFDQWNQRRSELIQVQAERLNLTLRLEEIEHRRAELVDKKKLLFFFDNRVQWEDKAREKDELFEMLNLNKKESAETEKEYAESLFENARRISQGNYTAPVLKKNIANAKKK